MDVINVPPSLPGTPIWNPTNVTEGVTSMTPTEVNNLREFYDFLYETCCMAHYTTNNGNHFSSNDSSKYIDHDGGHRTTHHASQFSTNNSSADVSVCSAHNGGNIPPIGPPTERKTMVRSMHSISRQTRQQNMPHINNKTK